MNCCLWVNVGIFWGVIRVMYDICCCQCLYYIMNSFKRIAITVVFVYHIYKCMEWKSICSSRVASCHHLLTHSSGYSLKISRIAFHFRTLNLHYLGIRWTAKLERKGGLSSALNYLFSVFKRNVSFKSEVSGWEHYDNLRLTLISGQYCSHQRSLLWSSYTGPSTSPTP